MMQETALKNEHIFTKPLHDLKSPMKY